MKAVALLLLLSGCTCLPRTEVVKVPIPVACIDAPMAEPLVTADAVLLGMGDADLMIALAVDRARLIGWSLEAMAVMKACESGRG